MLERDALILIVLALVFAGSHIVLSLKPVRGRMVSALGEAGFVAFYCGVAVFAFTALVTYYATHAPPLLGRHTVAIESPTGAVGAIVITFGICLIVDCILHYTKSPSAPKSAIDAHPRGVQQITRHPFLVGMFLLFAVHFAFATHTLSAIFFAGFALLAALGIVHLDKKLAARKGQDYVHYMEKTSVIPFLATLIGKHRLNVQDLPLLPFIIGIAATVAIYYLHDVLMAESGLWFVGAIISVGVGETLLAWRVKG